MLSNLAARLSAFFQKTAPDPFTLAVLLTLVSAGASLVFMLTRDDPQPPIALLDAWRGDGGLWRFLAFSMQMCLILVTGHALAASRPVARLIRAVGDLPASGRSGAALVGFVAALTGLLNWGLGLIVGALLAREVGRSLQRRGIAHHYPLLAAAGYMGLLVWHAGFSGSAPLSVTTPEGARKVLPQSALESLGSDTIPLSQTLLSPMNITLAVGMLLLIPFVLALLDSPSERIGAREWIDEADAQEAAPRETIRSIPEWLEHTPLLAWVLAMGLFGAFVRYGQVAGLDRLGLNEVNTIMLALGLLCHGSLASYARAAEEAARGCAGIIIQFPLYAGIMAMLDASGLIDWFAAALARGGESLAPILTYISAAVVNLFVPSGGGQWGIQGPIALQAALDAGIAPGKMVMAVAYGDQLTNMLQPFWALPLLAITRVRARDIIAYTTVVMVVAGLWYALVLAIL